MPREWHSGPQELDQADLQSPFRIPQAPHCLLLCPAQPAWAHPLLGRGIEVPFAFVGAAVAQVSNPATWTKALFHANEGKKKSGTSGELRTGNLNF